MCKASQWPVGGPRVPVIKEADNYEVVLRYELPLRGTDRIIVGQLFGRRRPVPPEQRCALPTAIEWGLAADDRVLARTDSSLQHLQGRRVGGHNAGYRGFGLPEQNAVGESIGALAL